MIILVSHIVTQVTIIAGDHVGGQPPNTKSLQKLGKKGGPEWPHPFFQVLLLAGGGNEHQTSHPAGIHLTWASKMFVFAVFFQQLQLYSWVFIKLNNPSPNLQQKTITSKNTPPRWLMPTAIQSPVWQFYWSHPQARTTVSAELP